MTSAEDPTLVTIIKPGRSEHHIKEEPVENGINGNGHQPSGDESSRLVKQEGNSIHVDLYINNVVSSFSTRCHLALRRIAYEGMNVEYKKENNMLNMRLRRPYTTASVWSSGKITCTGATSEPDAYKAARRYSRLLQKLKFNVRIAKYRVVNVLATCQMPFCIDIHRLAQSHERVCTYEPELHPGATYKISELSATLKIFTTGSITLTAPSVSLVDKAVHRIFPIVYQFRRKVVEEPPAAPISSVHHHSLYSNNSQQNTIILNKQSNCSKEIIMAQRIGDTVVLNGYGGGTTANQTLIHINNNSNQSVVSSINNTNTPNLLLGQQYSSANIFDQPTFGGGVGGGSISDFYPNMGLTMTSNSLTGLGNHIGNNNPTAIQTPYYSSANNNYDVFSSSLLHHHPTYPVVDQQQATSQATTTTQSFHWYSENVLEDFLP